LSLRGRRCCAGLEKLYCGVDGSVVSVNKAKVEGAGYPLRATRTGHMFLVRIISPTTLLLKQNAEVELASNELDKLWSRFQINISPMYYLTTLWPSKEPWLPSLDCCSTSMIFLPGRQDSRTKAVPDGRYRKDDRSRR